jgi:hypothetical protein
LNNWCCWFTETAPLAEKHNVVLVMELLAKLTIKIINVTGHHGGVELAKRLNPKT